MNRIMQFGLLIVLVAELAGCTKRQPSSDDVQSEQQEKITAQGTAQVGMPNLVNFQRRKDMKEIIELLDQAHNATYTYLGNEMGGQVGDKLCNSIGYPIPAAMQFTNPMKAVYSGGNYAYFTLPQADPDGLFAPSSTEGTFVKCQNPRKLEEVGIVYSEPRLIVSPFPLK